MTDFPPPSQPSQEATSTTAPGWYFDGTQQRWWDGTHWGPAQTSSDDNTLATLSHLGVVVGGVILPLVMYLISKDGRRPETRRHAREALNFQLTYLLLWIPAVLVYIFVIFAQTLNNDPGDAVSGGFVVTVILFVVFAFVVSITALVFGVRGALKANKGIHYRYPICIRFLKG